MTVRDDIESEIGHNGNGLLFKVGVLNVVSVALAVGITWGTFQSEVRANDERSRKNERQIEQLLTRLAEENASRRVLSIKIEELTKQIEAERAERRRRSFNHLELPMNEVR